MNAKQRVLAAVEHRLAERTPITFDAQSEVYDALYEHLGLNSREALFDRLGCDTWMVLPRQYSYPATQSGRKVKTSIWG